MSDRPHNTLSPPLSCAGIQFMQRLTGCELLENGTEGRMILLRAFNAESGDMVFYNKNEASFVPEWKWPINSQADEPNIKRFLSNVCNPLCMKMLRSYLKREKHRIGKQRNLFVHLVSCELLINHLILAKEISDFRFTDINLIKIMVIW